MERRGPRGSQERLTGDQTAPIWTGDRRGRGVPGDLCWRRWEEGWRLSEANLCPKWPECPPRPHLTAPPPVIPPPPAGPGALPPQQPDPAIRVTRAFPPGRSSRMFPPSRREPGSQGRVSGLEPQTQGPVPEPEPPHRSHDCHEVTLPMGGRAEDRSFLLSAW